MRFINLFPNYATPEQLGTKNYQEYLDTFLTTVKPDVLCYDHYALMKDGTLRPDYFQNLAFIREAALRHGVPAWNGILSWSHGPYASPTPEQMRWQVWTSLRLRHAGHHTRHHTMTPQPTTRRQAFTIAGLVLLGASLAASARASDPPASSTVRDRLWVWGLDASFDWPAHEEGESPAKNRMSPVEGAVHLGVPNVMFIQYQGIPAAPFQQYYPPFKAMKQVYWTLSNNGNQVHELGQEQECVYQLAADNPNITGLLLDDFLIGPFGDSDDSHWLAANNATFPVSLVLSLPQEVVADSLVLTQTAWEGGGYRTAKCAVDVSRDGTNWQEVVTGELPDEAGATRKLSFPSSRWVSCASACCRRTIPRWP